MVWATVGLVVAYMIAIIILVIVGARRTKSMADYAVGTVEFSPITVGLSLAAGITSAATFIINPGFIALYGWSAFLAYGVATPLGLYISLILLTKSFRKYGSNVKALTMAQWIAKRFDTPQYGLFFALLSLLLITFVVLICVGMTQVLAPALNADKLLVLIGLVFFVFGYMMFGGANSMVYTNTIQAVIMLIVAVILLTSGHQHFSNGINNFINKLTTLDPQLTQFPHPQSPLFRDFFETVICSFVVGVAVVCQPHIITRSLLLKKESDVNKYLIVGIAAETIFFAVVFVGFYARLSFPNLTTPEGAPMKMDTIIPIYVIKEFSIFVGLFVILGLLSAGLSTLEGLIQSISTTVTSDIIGRYLPENETKPQKLFIINRLVIVVLAIVSLFASYQQLVNPNLTVGIFAQNGVYAYFSAAFTPVLLGIYCKDVPKIAPIAASLTAVIVHFSLFYGKITWYMAGKIPNPAVSATFAILISLAVGFTLHFSLRKK